MQTSATLRLTHAFTLGWVKLVAVSFERRGYHGARCVTVNYESVWRLLEVGTARGQGSIPAGRRRHRFRGMG